MTPGVQAGTVRSGRALTLGVLTLTLAGSASAQTLNLTAYRTLAQQLDTAAAGAGQNSLATLKQLDAAQTAFDQLKPTLSSAKLGGSLQDTLNAVRAAQARTPVELQAQVHLARGLMRKALYDQTMNLLATAPANGAAQLDLLARELGVDPAGLQADLKGGQLNRVAWKVQKSVAAKLSAALNGVQAQQSGASYLNLARAAGWFTVVQDAARDVNPPLNTGQFSQALTQLAGGQLQDLQRSVQALRTGVSALNSSLASPGAATQREAVPAPEAPTPPPAPAGTQEASRGGGVARISGPAPLYASLGRALAAATGADLPAARAALVQAQTDLAAAPAALRAAPGFGALVQHTQAMARRQGLRPADVQALIGELSALEVRQAGGRPPLMASLASGSAAAFGGGFRAVLGLLLALLAAVPLYLLNLAFGGKNPFWRAISAALLLLLLPSLADGVLGFLGWLGDTMQVPFLGGLLTLTPGQSAFGVPLRMLITALALALATYGFRGLCIQFGLLGGRKQSAPRPAVLKPKAPDQTSFDWDEEL